MNKEELEVLAFELMRDCVSSSLNCEVKVKAALVEKGVVEDDAADAAKVAFNKIVDIYTA